ncbi:MAG: hypothetical protein SLAVMIC_00609 [uncultured marine phage]|uniref:Uncharacterized protein n=1 Tax=uncultured marine phage TaxID=707152 RepID=A0A8D9C981_9VIRU|nr:MAG: hypothetical protein SLAVMIC_00609 [uncultured marine phage]
MLPPSSENCKYCNEKIVGYYNTSSQSHSIRHQMNDHLKVCLVKIREERISKLLNKDDDNSKS